MSRACRPHIRRRLVAIDVVVGFGWGVVPSLEHGAWRHHGRLVCKALGASYDVV